VRATSENPKSRCAAGWAHLALSHLHGDLPSIRQALDLAIQHGEPMLELSCRNAIALATATSRPSEAWDHAESSAGLARRVGQPWADVMAILTHGAALCHVDPDAALTQFERGATLATRHGYNMLATVGRTIAGFAAPTRSPLDRINIVCHGLNDAAVSQSQGWLQLNLHVLAQAFAELGQHDRAAVLAEAAGDDAANRPVTPASSGHLGQPADPRSHRPDRPSITEVLGHVERWRDELARSQHV
jgi:hypothetical protein